MQLIRRVRIQLSGGNDTVLYPGDLVSGTIEYKGPAGDYLASVTVDFRGVAKVVPRRNSRFAQEYIEFFHMQQQILNAPFDMKDATAQVWSFQFMLPDSTGPDKRGGFRDNDNPDFVAEQHALPPSLVSEQGDQALIIYHMYVIVLRRSLHNLRLETVTHSLENLRCSPAQSRFSSQTVVDRTCTAVPLSRRRSSLKGILDAGKPLGKEGRAPTLNLKAPGVVQVGESISLRFSFPGVEEPGEDQFLLRVVSAEIIARTSIRTTNAAAENFPNQASVLRLQPHVKAARTTRSAVDAPQVFSTAGLEEWPPSFKTYSISRSYQLYVDVVISQEGTSSEFSVHYEVPVELVKPMSTEALQRRVSSAPPPLPALPDEEEELPSYERVMTGEAG